MPSSALSSSRLGVFLHGNRLFGGRVVVLLFILFLGLWDFVEKLELLTTVVDVFFNVDFLQRLALLEEDLHRSFPFFLEPSRFPQGVP